MLLLLLLLPLLLLGFVERSMKCSVDQMDEELLLDNKFDSVCTSVYVLVSFL